jgi:hypothetical protein
VIEAGTRNDTTGLVLSSGGLGSIGVFDGFGNVVIYNGVGSSPINITTGSNGGNVSFDGFTHNANINGSGSKNDVLLIEEGDGGSSIGCGGGVNNVQVVFSHHATIHDGGGINNIVINSDFDNTGGYGAVAVGSTVTSGNGEIIQRGDTSHDYISVQVGGGTNNIVAFAGNIDVKAGGGYDTLYVQGTGTVGAKSFSSQYVDVLSYKGIDSVVLAEAV